jgi:Flp pilus assembly pilin Flp
MVFYGWFDRTRSRCRRERGQTMAEYAVVLGVIVPAIIIAYTLLSDRIAALIDSVRAIIS